LPPAAQGGGGLKCFGGLKVDFWAIFLGIMYLFLPQKIDEFISQYVSETGISVERDKVDSFGH
jgi:hypothetical protein